MSFKNRFLQTSDLLIVKFSTWINSSLRHRIVIATEGRDLESAFSHLRFLASLEMTVCGVLTGQIIRILVKLNIRT